MTEGRIEIPGEANEALAKSRHGRVLYEHWADVGGERRARLLEEARLDVEAAYPHLLAAWTERLLSDEALQAGADALCIERPATEGERNEVRLEIEAALASIERDGGTD
jgi:hypothetical protein